MQYFIRDAIRTKFRLIESHHKRNGLYLTGLFHKLNMINTNKRIYERSAYECAIDEIYKDIKERRMIGELGHPSYLDINEKRASHLVTDIYIDKNSDDVYGTIYVLDKLPYGKMLRGLFEHGVNTGVSARGYADSDGILVEDDIMKIVSGYHIVTYDVVVNPAFSGVMSQI